MTPFIMIVGCPRSGTTLMRNMLTAHPDIFIFPQTQFFNKIWGARNLYNFKRNRIKILKIISEDAAVKRSGLDIFSGNTNEWHKFDSYFNEYIEFIEKYNDKKKRYIGDKTPRHTMFVDQLRSKIKADIKTIAVVRDSRAVVASLKARKLVRTVEEGAAIWNFFCKYIVNLRLKLSEKEILLLKYEEIVAAPVARSHDLSRFIGIDYDPAMVNIKGNNSSFDRSAQTGIFPESLNTWKEKLSASEVNIVSCLTKKYMDYFKYEVPAVSNNISMPSWALYWSSSIREEISRLLMLMGLFPTPLLEKIKGYANR